MRHCTFCNGDRFAVTSCLDRKLVFENESDGPIERDASATDLVDPIEFGEESDPPDTFEGKDRCPECGVERGEYHHVGCTNEECPHCDENLTSCDCDPHVLTLEEEAT